MKVKCKIDRISKRDNRKWLYEWANTEEELEITKDSVYTVLAISKYNNHYFYYILGDESKNYPLAFPIVLFEIIDHNISSFWEYDSEIFKNFDDLAISNHEVCSFKKWTMEKDHYYEKILEEDKKTLEHFSSIISLMLNE